MVELRHERGESTGDAVNRLHRKPTHYKQKQKKKNGIRCRVNKRRERRGETKTIFSFPKKIFAKREKKGWGRLTACIAGHAIQRKNPQDESQRFSKWRLPDLFYARAKSSDWGVFGRFARSAIRGTPSPAQRVQTCTASWKSKGDGTRKAPLRNSQRRFKVAATYSPTTQCRTIGDAELNDPVRNGKGWDLSAITT